MRNPLRKLAVACAAIAFFCDVAEHAKASDITVYTSEQGWVNDTGTGNGAYSNNNAFTGNSFSNRFNSWASFTVPTWAGSISAASLDILLVEWPFNSSIPYTIGVYDVSTPFSSLAGRSSGVAGYTDLGSGNLYGTVTGSNGHYTVSLSAQAIADISAAQGGTFILGFTNITLNAVPTDNTSGAGVYTNGNTGGYPRLILTPTAAVPEPSSLALAGLGGIGLMIGGIRRRRNQAT